MVLKLATVYVLPGMSNYVPFQSALNVREPSPDRSLGPRSKRQLNRFSRFCRAHGHDQQARQVNRHNVMPT